VAKLPVSPFGSRLKFEKFSIYQGLAKGFLGNCQETEFALNLLLQIQLYAWKEFGLILSSWCAD